jgi:hypothetical protein
MNEAQARHSRTLSRQDTEEAFLYSLRLSLEIGFCVNVRLKLARHAPYLEASTFPAVLAEYAAIREEAENIFRLEEVHGAGSLLNLDHPVIKGLVGRIGRDGLQTIPTAHVEAAKRCRAISQADGC